MARNAQIDHFRNRNARGGTSHESEEDVFSEIASPGSTPEEQPKSVRRPALWPNKHWQACQRKGVRC